eukprot:4198550-Pyramimonas_sp.AAC.2
MSLRSLFLVLHLSPSGPLGIFPLPLCGWVTLWVYSLCPRVVGSQPLAYLPRCSVPEAEAVEPRAAADIGEGQRQLHRRSLVFRQTHTTCACEVHHAPHGQRLGAVTQVSGHHRHLQGGTASFKLNLPKKRLKMYICGLITSNKWKGEGAQ